MIRFFTHSIAKSNIIKLRMFSSKANPSSVCNDNKLENNKKKDAQQLPWKPTKRVSRVTMEKIRSLAAMYPDHYNTVSLATEFKISPEAVKRILKSKFQPDILTAERQEKNRYAAMGIRKKQIQNKTITFPSTIPRNNTYNRKYNDVKRQSSLSSSSSLSASWKKP
ncbi:uncharacterized protein BX664DRAFT_335874 [Halteromyces radiatus]|uniref:uncharacterized protein n=1 Tax=Halteromyces radiatus TaxID=101107 RepID=UPI002220EF28|nr:uncharacterized protein BX664DRAFT_335874 [Halteromyces radiatus]KAI8086468.1 hypothetical protein BX664DRAFT_335874 [Halteromyces radiatus]